MKSKMLGLLAVGLLAGPMAVNAAMIYESATMGPAGQSGGVLLATDQFLGSRFNLSSSAHVTGVGGHIYGFGTLFGAIVGLNGPGALPTGDPLSSGEVIATFTFDGVSASIDQSIPLSVTLGPGNYALVFGSGLFGASGVGGMPSNNADTGSGSYFFWNGSQWQNGGFGGTRFVVYGGSAPVPEPGTLALLGLGLAGLGLSRRRKAN